MDSWSARTAARARAAETAIADLHQGDCVYPGGKGAGVVTGIIDVEGWAAVSLEDGRTLAFRPGETVKAVHP